MLVVAKEHYEPHTVAHEVACRLRPGKRIRACDHGLRKQRTRTGIR